MYVHEGRLKMLQSLFLQKMAQQCFLFRYMYENEDDEESI
jgi:hypothetical protein